MQSEIEIFDECDFFEKYTNLRNGLEKAVSFVAEQEGIDDGTITLILLRDEEILEMNRKFLNHDYLTDVISFKLEEEPFEGEIYIGAFQAERQSAEFGSEPEKELIRVAIHGILHLAGFDDKTELDKMKMRELEDYYLQKTGN